MILPAIEETSRNFFWLYSNESRINHAQKISTGISYLKLLSKSSSLKITDKVTIKPGTEDEEISLLELSSTGGVVNAYDALKLAANTKGERKTTTQIKKTK